MAATPRRKVLLIGWDAADWEHITPLLEEGLLPTLDGLINRGVMGNLATLQPILSPMLWNSVATGKFADKHGILGFIEPDPVNGGARPYTSTSRKCKALWNILTESGLRSNVVGWWASHPAEPINGTVVTNGFGGVKFDPEKGWSIPKGTVHPAAKGPELARYKVFPAELTQEHILPFVPGAAKIDQQEDQRLFSFAKILSDAASIHAVATALMEREPWDFTAVYYDAVDHFSHGFMPYHPPRLDWIEEADFALYKDVVRGAYRFHDMMLERLLQLAGSDTTVILCSDHGFESGSQRPRGIPREPAGPAAWHRQYGIFVIAGPGIRRDERIYGASLIDIAPTVLALLSLPVGRDMDGRPLLEAFEAPPEVATIESWEKTGGDAGQHTAGHNPATCGRRSGCFPRLPMGRSRTTQPRCCSPRVSDSRGATLRAAWPACAQRRHWSRRQRSSTRRSAMLTPPCSSGRKQKRLMKKRSRATRKTPWHGRDYRVFTGGKAAIRSA